MKVFKSSSCPFLIISILFFCCNQSIAKKMSLIGASYGIPSGYMDFSANCSFSVKFEERHHLKPQLLFQESFSVKADREYEENDNIFQVSDEEKSKLWTNVISLYMLGLKEFPLKNTGLTPYISTGLGYHLIRSWSNKYAALKSYSKTSFTIKAHLFLGIEIRSKAATVIFAKVRATFPSDIFFDSIYFGLGIDL